MKPDWEAFGIAVMESWPRYDIECMELQDLAEQYGIIIKVDGGFNPDVHIDDEGCAEPGDEWFLRNYDLPQEKADD